jgi:glutamate-1-semialdehyde 2,1-aminomutase
MFGLFFVQGATTTPRNYDEVKKADTKRFAAFFQALLDEGVALAPSAFEVGFVSAAHSDAVIDETVAAVDRALTTLGRS